MLYCWSERSESTGGTGREPERHAVEFRNHQTRILHQYRQITSSNPLAAVLFALLFLVLLIPVVLLLLAGVAISLIALPIRAALLHFARPKGSGPVAAPPRAFNDDDDDPPPGGPIIDVEVTRSNWGP